MSSVVAVAMTVAMAGFHPFPAIVLFHADNVAVTMAVTTVAIKAQVGRANVNANVGTAVACFCGCSCSAQADSQCRRSSDSNNCFADHCVRPFCLKVEQDNALRTSDHDSSNMNSR
jgi:hypothetical protein